MSTPQPPRRRRIAGERRSASPAPGREAEPTPPTDDVEPVRTAEPVDLGKPAQPAQPTEPEPLPERATAPEPEEEPVRGTGSGWWGSTASLVALGVALVLLLVVTGLGLAGLLGNRGVLDIREASQTADAQETAPSVAERAAAAILAYDHARLDADEDAAERFMTPEFAKKYSASFDKVVKPAARTYKATVTVDVKGSSVVRATPDRVRVLVFVDQTTVATNKQNPQVALNRVEFDMVQRGGSWLVDDITSY